jgi:hypothetical protein
MPGKKTAFSAPVPEFLAANDNFLPQEQRGGFSQGKRGLKNMHLYNHLR